MSDKQLVGDVLESTINYPYRDTGDEICLYTMVESLKDSWIKRNPNCRVEADSWGWIVYYPRDEVRHPRTWVRVASNEADTDTESCPEEQV